MSLMLGYWQSAGAAVPAGLSYYEYLLANVTSLRVLWKLDEASGTVMTDSSGNAHNGTYTNAPGYGLTGPLSSGETGMSFNGTDEYGSHAHHADWNLGTSDFSVGMWIKDASWPTAAAEHCVFGHDGNGDGGSWHVMQYGSGADIVLRLNGTLSVSRSSSMGDGGWHLLGFSVDRDSATGGKCYIDGVVVATDTDVTPLSAVALDVTKTLYVARRETTGYAGVTLAGAFLAASLVSADTWAALYAARNGGGLDPDPDTQAATFDAAVLALTPKGYWKMDDTSTTMTDSSGLVHHGTYYATPTWLVAGPMTGGYGVTFAAASAQYASVPDHADFAFGTADMSVLFWIKRSTAWPVGEEHIVSKSGNGASTDWETRAGYGEDLLSARVDAVTVPSNTSVNLNNDAWHMVVLTLDRDGNGVWYVDGAAHGSTSIASQSAVSLTNTSPLYIARRNAGDYWTGSLSRVAVFASLLSAGQVTTLWTAAGN